jgi:PIN domain
MRNTYMLIDYENVPVKSLPSLDADAVQVLVFVNENLTKVSLDVASAMQNLGARSRYIRMSGHGSNALDFHIAYYLGALAAKDPAASFLVISKDSGFDPLIAHLKYLKICAARVEELPKATAPKVAPMPSMAERTAPIVKLLRQQGAAKPKSVKTLSSQISAQFQRQLSADELAAMLAELQHRGVIIVNGTKVSYVLPDEAT